MGIKWVRVFEGSMMAAILWAVGLAAAPRMSQAQEEKRLPVMIERLHEVRTAISHFKADHGGLLPGQTAAGGAITAESFAAALQSERKDASGPYLEYIPENPFVLDREARSEVIVSDAADIAAWRFCPRTGTFRAASSEFHASY